MNYKQTKDASTSIPWSNHLYLHYIKLLVFLVTQPIGYLLLHFDIIKKQIIPLNKNFMY